MDYVSGFYENAFTYQHPNLGTEVSEQCALTGNMFVTPIWMSCHWDISKGTHDIVNIMFIHNYESFYFVLCHLKYICLHYNASVKLNLSEVFGVYLISIGEPKTTLSYTNTVKPVYNDHLMGYFSASEAGIVSKSILVYSVFIKHFTDLITGNKFYYRGGRYRQVSLYCFDEISVEHFRGYFVVSLTCHGNR